MKPMVFGDPERRLFGIHHAPDAGRANGTSVLMCNPFGHEAIRIHRLFRVLSERLAKSGCHVLRFDYFGTGDSMGEDEDGDLLGWQRDILTAHRTLQTLSGNAATRWLGARLGASIALQAAQTAGVPLHALVLWDPVVDGAAYSKMLRVHHVEALELSYCIPDTAWRRSLTRDDSAFQDEAIGFATTPLLRGQMNELNLPACRLANVDSMVVLAQSADTPVSTWAAAVAGCGQRIRRVAVDHGMVWTSDPQPNMAMVPATALAQLSRELETAA